MINIIDKKLPRFEDSRNGDPEIQLSCVSNVYIRMMHFKHSGDIEKGHSHPFDHTTLLSYGSLEVSANGSTKVFHAPQMIFIKKETMHELKALEDGTVAFCIHAIRNGERIEDIIDPNSFVIPPGGEGIDLLNDSTLMSHIVNQK